MAKVAENAAALAVIVVPVAGCYVVAGDEPVLHEYPIFGPQEVAYAFADGAQWPVVANGDDASLAGGLRRMQALELVPADDVGLLDVYVLAGSQRLDGVLGMAGVIGGDVDEADGRVVDDLGGVAAVVGGAVVLAERGGPVDVPVHAAADDASMVFLQIVGDDRICIVAAADEADMRFGSRGSVVRWQRRVAALHVVLAAYLNQRTADAIQPHVAQGLADLEQRGCVEVFHRERREAVVPVPA